MPQDKNAGKDPENSRTFIREKVARPPMTKRQAFVRMAAYALLALLCGAAAGTAFAVAGPVAEKYLAPPDEETPAPVTIPTDVETASAATYAAPETLPETAAPETTPAEISEEASSEEETEPIEEILQSAIEKYSYTIDDINSMYDSLHGLVQEADAGIVTVHSLRQETDWFDNPLETSGQYSGIVIAATESGYLILTPAGAVEDADSLRVAFMDGSEAPCTVRQIDRITGMAVVSVDSGEIDPDMETQIRVLALGNSYMTRQGDLLVAVGSPTGLPRSSAYGEVAYILRNVQTADGTERLFYVDAPASAPEGTFFLNTSGELVGWATDRYDGGRTAAVVGISDYKHILEKLSNGIPAPYLGIRGQEVSEEMAGSGMPRGLYVSECITDGPAYDAGIQNGDIITRIGEEEVTSMAEFQARLGELRHGEIVTVTLQRKGLGEYIELQYEVVLGAR